MSKFNLFTEILIAFLLVILFDIVNNDLVVVFLITIQTRLFLAVVIKDIHITTTYLYAQLILTLLVIICIVIATIFPILASIITKICPIIITFINSNAMKEEEYQKWLIFVKRVTMIHNDVIVYLEKED
jgi:hypothetical protein